MDLDSPSQLLSMGLASKASHSLWDTTPEVLTRGLSYLGYSTEAAPGVFCYTTLMRFWQYIAIQAPDQLSIRVCFPRYKTRASATLLLR